MRIDIQSYKAGMVKALREHMEKQAAIPNPFKKEESSWTDWAAPLGAAAGLGLGAYALARRPSLANAKKWPILRKIQEMSKGKMYRADIRGAPQEIPKGVEKLKREVKYGPEAFEEGLPRKAMGTTKKPTSVWSGKQEPIEGTFDPSIGPHAGETEMAEWGQQYINHLGDKMEQFRLLAKVAPGTMARTMSMKEVAKKHGLKKLTKKNLQKNLPKWQEAMNKEFGGEYLIKSRMGREGGDIAAASSGVFPTAKTDLREQYKLWRKMKPEYDKAVQEVEESLGDADINKVIERFRTRPGFEGRMVDEMLHNNAIFQDKLQLKKFSPRVSAKLKEQGFVPNKEYRIHSVGGKAIPSLAVPRSFPGYLRMLPEMIRARRAAKWTQKNVLDKLKDTSGEISYGMDVAPLKGGGYRVIEMNPGGASGLLEQPFMNPRLHKAVTGRHTQAVSGGLGLGAAGLGALGTSAAMPD